MPKAYCPSCDAVISMNNPREGATVTCRECDTKLEVISIDPFEVDFPIDFEDSDDAEWEADEG